MLRSSAIAMIALSILHMVILGYDAANHVPDALRGDLWTWEHWGPVSGQRHDLVVTGFAFWSTIGSFAVPMGVLGALILWLSKRDMPVPRFVGIALLIWAGLSAVLMAPSGFPIAVLVAAGLCLGLSGTPRDQGNRMSRGDI